MTGTQHVQELLMGMSRKKSFVYHGQPASCLLLPRAPRVLGLTRESESKLVRVEQQQTARRLEEKSFRRGLGQGIDSLIFVGRRGDPRAPAAAAAAAGWSAVSCCSLLALAVRVCEGGGD